MAQNSRRVFFKIGGEKITTIQCHAQRLIKENDLSLIFLDLPQTLHATLTFLDFLDLPRSSSTLRDLPRSFPDLPLSRKIRATGFEGGDHCVRPTAKFGNPIIQASEIMRMKFANTSYFTGSEPGSRISAPNP